MMLITLARYAATLAGAVALATLNQLTASRPQPRPALVLAPAVVRTSRRWS